jgi:hypothetical protein
MQNMESFKMGGLERAGFSVKESPFKAKRSLLEKSIFGQGKVSLQSSLCKLQQLFPHLCEKVSSNNQVQGLVDILAENEEDFQKAQQKLFQEQQAKSQSGVRASNQNLKAFNSDRNLERRRRRCELEEESSENE